MCRVFDVKGFGDVMFVGEGWIVRDLFKDFFFCWYLYICCLLWFGWGVIEKVI